MTALGAILSTSDLSEAALVTAGTPGATVTLTVTNTLRPQVFYWTAGEAEAVVISGSHPRGKSLMVMILNDASLFRVITFTTGFVSLGTVTGIVSKTSIVSFLSDGTNFVEMARTVAI